MVLDYAATFAAGIGFAALIFVLRHLSGGRLPKWFIPLSLGAGMLLFSVWNEYTWYERTTGKLPEQVVILSSPSDRVWFRPWTYLFPVSTRFMAFDGTSMKVSEQKPALRRADILVVERWLPTTRIPLAFDCESARRADLIDGADLSADGTLTGTDWHDADPTDELQRTACKEMKG